MPHTQPVSRMEKVKNLNTGFSYPYASWHYENTGYNEIVASGEIEVLNNNAAAPTVGYKDEVVFSANVTELIFTVMDFSRIDQAQFRIVVNK